MDSKSEILRHARALFGERGFDGTTLRELAARAEVNVAMVAYYFGDKEGLYLACIADLTQDRMTLIKQILVAPLSREDFAVKFRVCLLTLASAMASEASLVRLILRELQNKRGQGEISDAVLRATLPLYELIRGFLSDTLEKGIIAPRLNADLLTIQVMSMLVHPHSVEALMEKTLGYTLRDPEYQKMYVEQMIQLVFQGVYSEAERVTYE
jgi:AcrR family transcriptional regulator